MTHDTVVKCFEAGWETAACDVYPKDICDEAELCGEILSYGELQSVVREEWAEDLRNAITEMGASLWAQFGQQIIAHATAKYIRACRGDGEAEGMRAAAAMMDRFAENCAVTVTPKWVAQAAEVPA